MRSRGVVRLQLQPNKSIRTVYNVAIMATRRPVQAFEPRFMLAGDRRLRDVAPFHFDVFRASAVRY